MAFFVPETGQLVQRVVPSLSPKTSPQRDGRARFLALSDASAAAEHLGKRAGVSHDARTVRARQRRERGLHVPWSL